MPIFSQYLCETLLGKDCNMGTVLYLRTENRNHTLAKTEYIQAQNLLILQLFSEEFYVAL